MNTTRAHIPAQRVELPSWSTPMLAICGLLFLIWFLSTGVSQTVIFALLVSLGIIGALLRPSVVIVATFVFLPFLGDIRRFVSLEAGRTTNDPLILVAPVIAAVLFARLLFERQIRLDTKIAKLVVTMMVIMVIEIVNPLQGGIVVGLGGALYYIIPLLWFWIGRSTPTEKLAQTALKLIVPLVAAAAVALGMFQVYVGWLSFEARWIKEQSQQFSALMLGDKIVRPFAFYTSPAEFAGYLAIGFVCCAVPLLARRRSWTILLIAPIGYMLFLSAVRSAIVLAVVASLLVWGLQGRDSKKVITRVLFTMLVVLPCMYLGLRQMAGSRGAADRADVLKDHTVNGLVNPGESSAESHGNEALDGIYSGIKNPIGYGLGATTMAAGRFGNSQVSGFENDVANIFSSLGVAGGVLYIVLVFRVGVTALGVWNETRSLLALTIVAVLVCQAGNWLTGGHYSTVMIVWFLIGMLDRTQVPAPPDRPALARVKSHHANFAHHQ